MEQKLVLPFDSDEPEFARGFEAGRIWGILRRMPPERGLKADVQKTNAEMMLRMGEALGREVVSEDLEFEEGEEKESLHMSVKFGPTVEYDEV